MSKFADKLKAVVDRVACAGQHGEFRVMTEEEKILFEKFGNNVVSGKILIPSSTDIPSLSRVVRNNVFLNSVVLNLPTSPSSLVSVDPAVPGVTPSVVGNTLSNVFLDGAVFVKDNTMIHSAYIGPNCALVGNGVIAGDFAKDRFGIGSPFVLCEETGSRAIVTHPDATLEDLVSAIDSKASIAQWEERVKALIAEMDGVVGPHNGAFIGSVFLSDCRVSKCGSVRSVFLDSNVTLSDSDLSSSVIWSGAQVSLSQVGHSVLHRSVRVEQFAVVENSILHEFTKISAHAKVVHSTIGSYSGVESGECASSLIGPFVGFHHQSLCIATYWPGGRGNIGYGANVGSNHSGKAPDCELVAGEGVFFGLATVIKFPTNFSNAPYSLIASGVTCLPQRVDMPFSLINSPATPSSLAGLNEIFPAWVLSDNMFTLIRNEDKFAKRQKIGAHTEYNPQVFRADIMRMILDAREVLMNPKESRKKSESPSGERVYTETEIWGIGKNFLRESARHRAIDTYSFILRWYGLRGLYRRVQAVGLDALQAELSKSPVVHANAVSAPTNPTGVSLPNSEESEWECALSVLRREGMNLNELKSLLEEFAKLDFLIASTCVSSKAKDDVRGSKLMGPKYAEFHAPASEHPVCVGAKKSAVVVSDTVAGIVSRL